MIIRNDTSKGNLENPSSDHGLLVTSVFRPRSSGRQNRKMVQPTIGGYSF